MYANRQPNNNFNIEVYYIATMKIIIIILLLRLLVFIIIIIRYSGHHHRKLAATTYSKIQQLSYLLVVELWNKS